MWWALSHTKVQLVFSSLLGWELDENRHPQDTLANMICTFIGLNCSKPGWHKKRPPFGITQDATNIERHTVHTSRRVALYCGILIEGGGNRRSLDITSAFWLSIAYLIYSVRTGRE